MDIDVFFEAIRALGVAGGPVFAVLWWLERVERKAAQKEAKEQLVQMMTVASSAATAVAENTKAIASLGEASRDEVESLNKLSQLVNSYSTRVVPRR